VAAKRALIEADHPTLSVRRQCDLVGLARSSFYYAPATESEANLRLMGLIDGLYTKWPFLGWPRMTAFLREQGEVVNHKRVQRLMRLMGLAAVGPKPATSQPHPDHKVYPYLLHNVAVVRPCQVWSADITYCPLPRGFMYLVAVIDWFSRYVLAWRLSNTLDVGFCLAALDEALAHGTPDIFNTDQGAQFTAHAFTRRLETAQVRISMDGKGRAFDNIFVERLWRSVKYEDLYLKAYATVPEMDDGLAAYFRFYNHQRLHQRLDYRTPAAVHFGSN
jgi:putative transposase